MVVDLGYAGTIQRNLIRLSGEPIGGQYFALRETAKQLDGLGWAEARYFDGRQDPSGSSLILQHDLLLEALLSAPHGQFNGYFRDKNGIVHGEFGEQTLGSVDWKLSPQCRLARSHSSLMSARRSTRTLPASPSINAVCWNHCACLPREAGRQAPGCRIWLPKMTSVAVAA